MILNSLYLGNAITFDDAGSNCDFTAGNPPILNSKTLTVYVTVRFSCTHTNYMHVPLYCTIVKAHVITTETPYS